jgi:tripartite ATP-independent transporter DctM subunit
MTTVALPEMRKRNYDPALATGAIASGGNIGTLIPPSVAFVIYGIIAEQSIGRLFIAGIVPGVLMAALFIGTISIIAHRNPKLAPPGPISSIKEKLLAFKGVWVIILLFILVIGGIYTGIFTVTEIAGVGALGALIIGLALRRFTRQSLARSFRETIVITCMAFLLFMGGRIFGILIATSEIPFIAAEFIMGSGLSTLAILLVILLIFLILGCVMPGWPVMILMVPIIFPAVIALGWDPIWFGVMMVLMSEFGAITPPVGINVYVVAGVARDIPMSTVFRGTIPFLCALTILTVLLIAFPSIALFLPNLMMGP